MWGLITYAYHEIFFRPLLNGLLFLTSVIPTHDLGIAVIALTVAVRTILFPITHSTLKTQRAMKALEPDIKRIQQGKTSREEQSRALMELYKAHGINPFSGFMLLLIQLPLLIALYQVFWHGIPFTGEGLYSFLSLPESINTMFLGLVPLQKSSIGISALAAISQYWQARLAMPPKKNSDKPASGDFAAIMQKQMLYMFPVLIFILGFRLPAAVSLYWTAMNVFAIVHEAIVRRKADGQRFDHDDASKRTN